MSDLYNEATRNERGTTSRFIIFVGGGFLAVRSHLQHTRSRGAYMGYMAFMADASAEEIRMEPDGGVRERFAMEWGDWLVTVAITEDEFGGSFLVLLFRD